MTMMPYSFESKPHTVTACIVRASSIRDYSFFSLLPSNAHILVKAILGCTATDLRTLTIMQPDVAVLDLRDVGAPRVAGILQVVHDASPLSRIVSVGAVETPEFNRLALAVKARSYGREYATPASLRRAVLAAAADLNCTDHGHRPAVTIDPHFRR